MRDNDHLPTFPQDPQSLALRLQRARRAGVVALVDVSGSMTYPDGGLERRIDRLAKVLAQVLAQTRLEALVCFNDAVEEVALSGVVALPQPAGGTNLHLGLDYVGAIVPRPVKLIVLSDGVPESVPLALAAARRLAPMPIEAFRIGSDRDHGALDFMAQLAACGGPGSRWGHYDLGQVDQVAQALILAITDQSRSPGGR